MSDQTLRRLHVVTLAIAIPWLAGVLVLSLLNGSFSEDGAFIGTATLMIVGYITIASVTIRRQPRNAVGWLLLVIGFAFLVGGGSDEFVKYVFVTEPGSIPLGAAVAWVNGWVFVLFVGAIPILLSVFPTGRVLGPSWRPVLWLTVGSIAGLAAVTILRPGNLETDHAAIPNPTGVPALGPALDVLVWVAGLGLLLSAILSAVGLIVRFRRSSGDERQQVRWLASVSGVGLALLVLVFLTSIGLEDGETSRLNDLVFFAFFLVLAFGFPAAIAVAILKYRLYDLDLVIKKTLVFGIVVVLLVAALAFLALVTGALIGRMGLAESRRSDFVYAFVLGALTFPIWRVARRLADRIVYGGRASPYAVLSDFSERMSEAFSTDDVLPRMARVVAEAVGGQRVQIWLRVGSAVHPAGAWPEAATHGSISLAGSELPELGPGDPFEVRHQGELLGAVVLTMPANDPMNPSKARLVRDLAAQAGLVLRNVRLIEELRASRQRLVSAQDQERRRLERNIHDGAQQQLVALAVKLRLADSLVEPDPARARRLLDELGEETNQALQDLRDLARGIYPPLLADEGLGPALAAQARKAPIPVTVDADGIGRHPEDIEAAVYFTCLEALGNVAKHAVGATRAEIRLGRDDGGLRFSVADDGAGFDPASSPGGSGLQGIADRLEAIGGSVEIESAPGAGTVLRGSVPVGSQR